MKNNLYSLFIKRILDFIMAIILLLICSPFFLLIVFILVFTNRGKPFFVQERNGKFEKVFKVFKFKTMTDDTDDYGNLLPNKDRLTSIGKVIRKSSLDELPQLINIIKGEMSFIGPRPLPVRYLPFFTYIERKRFSIRPGISGLAQISGRNLLDWDSRLALDVKYVDNLSFKIDLWIFFKTIKNVLLKENLVVDPTTKMIDLDILRKNMINEKN